MSSTPVGSPVIGRETGLGVAACRRFGLDGDGEGAHQPLDFGHGLDQTPAFARAQRRQHAMREGIADTVDIGIGFAPGLGQREAAHAAVVFTGLGDDQALAFERPNQSADIAGIELEAAPQIAYLDAGPSSFAAAFMADLVEQPGLAVGPAEFEKAVR
jgi:hypothetical protein